MTAAAQVGTHVHPVDEPGLELVVDVVAAQGSAHAWYRLHDQAGHVSYLEADQVEPHGGRHRAPEPPTVPAAALPGRWPTSRGATITGVLPAPPYGPVLARCTP